MERSTRQRKAIREAIVKAARPLSPQEVLDAARTEVPGLSIATVYRNLNDLSDASIARRTDVGDHVWRFELVREGSEHGDAHPHFVCDECGVVAGLPEGSVEIKSTRGGPVRLKERVHEIQLKGRCERCA